MEAAIIAPGKTAPHEKKPKKPPNAANERKLISVGFLRAPSCPWWLTLWHFVVKAVDLNHYPFRDSP